MPVVTVLYFAHAQERSGLASETLELSARATLSDLCRLLIQRHPALTEVLPQCRFALDQFFVSELHELKDGSEIAVIPPVSGG